MSRKKRFHCLTVLGIFFFISLSAWGVEVVDDAGRIVKLKMPAKRIISLAPYLTEILFAAGAGSALVGTVNYSDYPKQALQIPRVGNYDSFDAERILALKPDLVVAWQSGNPTVQVERLRNLGLTIYLGEPRVFEDVPSNLERLGELTGTARTAQQAATAFRQRYTRLQHRYASRPMVSVFYEIWNQPLMTVNGEHLISRMMQLCGGRNVFAELAPLAPVIDLEAVLKADPEAIIASGMNEKSPEWLEDWRQYPLLRAVRGNNLFFIPPDLMQRNGPRILEGAEQVCQNLEQVRTRRAKH
ncbi:MAG: cobalamin-binding protein [Sulfuricaulis sp.]|uniref:cobalamin-binding protein n=1 Tax=Sulfuricaulis sp. TaxID=2003553 RepID=UPI0025F2C443|nr:cobalamin-binding protein [Sulfuricaulis sp.]MCR4346817.1 cobalamin-binding protein [Sulfuricaulis sp.]